MAWAAAPAPPFNPTPTGAAQDACVSVDFYATVKAVKPTLWALSPQVAYVGATITVIGTGFDPGVLTGMSLWLDYGSNPNTPDIQVATATWTHVAATGTADGRQLAPDGVSTVDRDVITFTVTSSMIGDYPESHQLYVRTPNGVSNRLTLAAYPLTTAQAIPTVSNNRTSATGGIDTGLPTTSPYVILRSSFSTMKYVVTDRYPERVPAFMVNQLPNIKITGGSDAGGLIDPVKAKLALTSRWRPDPAKVSPRPDLGTNASGWDASVGVGTLSWYYPSNPYIDTAHQLPSRLATITRPVMVFGGAAWARSEFYFVKDGGGNPLWSMVMAVRVFPQTQTKNTLICTDTGGTQNVADYLVEVRVDSGNTLVLWVRGKQVALAIPPAYRNGRVLVIGIRGTATYTKVFMLADKMYTMQVLTTAKKSTDSQWPPARFYLGRNNDPGIPALAYWELYDFAYSASAAAEATIIADMSVLDSVYGGATT